MVSWTTTLFAIAIAAHGVLLAGTLLQLVWARAQIWPPPGRRSWQFCLVWGLFGLGTSAGIGLGILDWNSIGLPAMLRLATGGLVTVVGLGLAFAAIARLGVAQSSGLSGGLATGGLYAWSRNPQYLGDVAATAGWMVLTGSRLFLPIGCIAIAWYLLLPRLEEPWLEQRFGDAYRRYRRRVPRFI